MDRRPNETFLQRRQMVNRHSERCLTSLIIGEMQIKTATNYDLTSVRKAIIKQYVNNKCWRGMEKREPSHTADGIVYWCSYNGKNSVKVPQQTKNRTSIWSSNLTSWHLSGKDKNSKSQRHIHPSVHCDTVYSNQNREPTYRSTDRGMDEEYAVHRHN